MNAERCELGSSSLLSVNVFLIWQLICPSSTLPLIHNAYFFFDKEAKFITFIVTKMKLIAVIKPNRGRNIKAIDYLLYLFRTKCVHMHM